MDQSAPPAQGVSAADGSMLEELVERARQGEHAAFAALFARYNAPICRYLARLVSNVELGHDLAQETFLHAWRSLSRLRSRLIEWLPWSVPLESTAGSARFERLEDQIGEAEQVMLALAALPPKRRACVLLAFEGGFTHREIARLVGISQTSVSTYLSRGCQQFRHEYERLANEQHAAVIPTKGGPAR